MTGFAVGKTLNYGYPGTVSRSADAIIENRFVRDADTTNINFGSAVALNSDNTYSAWDGFSTTLSTALTSGTAYTSISVPALASAVEIGDQVVLSMGASNQTLSVTAAAAVGATSITVASFTANAAYSTSTVVIVSNAATQFAGIAVREVKTNLTYVTNASGYYEPGKPCDVLERGSATIQVNNGTPTANGNVYVRIATNASIPNGVIGGFEAAADGVNTVLLSNVKFKTGLIDANNVAEVTLLTRNLA